MDRLKGKFKHYCHDWDGLAIDETCPEFLACTCKFEDEEGRRRAVDDIEAHIEKHGMFKDG